MLSLIGGVFSFFGGIIKWMLFRSYREAGRQEERARQAQETLKDVERSNEVREELARLDPGDRDRWLRERLSKSARRQ